jgi:predicted TIM-barrel fold metal-dependent hydrolase
LSPAEDILEPDLPIIDAHHHIWITGRRPQYPPERIMADKAGSGHKVVATVFIEAHEGYREDGPEHLRAVAETEMARRLGDAALAMGGGAEGACAGIVAFVDLTGGRLTDEALEAHAAAAGGRLRGVRQMAVVDAELAVKTPPGLLADAEFRRGFAALAPRDLAFDVMVAHPQLAEVADLARAFPETTLVLDHVGTPIGVGRFEGRRAEAFAEWRAGLALVAACPNVVCKLGGLYIPPTGLGPRPPRQVGSEEMASAQREHLLAAIDLFGPDRCLFESNFPVDMPFVSYVALWNGFKRVTAGFSRAEREGMFHDAAARVYRLDC